MANVEINGVALGRGASALLLAAMKELRRATETELAVPPHNVYEVNVRRVAAETSFSAILEIEDALYLASPDLASPDLDAILDEALDGALAETREDDG